jgi:hypothetical protein
MYFVLISIISIMSVRASVIQQIELEDVRLFCTKYNLYRADWGDVEDFAQEIQTELKRSVSPNNQFGAPDLDWVAAFYFYNNRRVEGEFGLLADLFKKISIENREPAFYSLNAWAAYKSIGPMLCKIKGLKEHLLQLPYQPD